VLVRIFIGDDDLPVLERVAAVLSLPRKPGVNFSCAISILTMAPPDDSELHIGPVRRQKPNSISA
jgi:hypothetical protein